MNNTLNNMDDLFDDNIGISLRQLGVIFPREVADFKRIESQVKKNKIIQPEHLKDPFSFLGKRTFKSWSKSTGEEDEKLYSQNLAQAARDGKIISDEIKKKMVEDKLKSSQKKNGN